MIYDGNLQPFGQNEYQERLLSQTMLLVMAAGGEIVVSTATMMSMGTHHVLEQDRLADGGIRLRVRAVTKGE